MTSRQAELLTGLRAQMLTMREACRTAVATGEQLDAAALECLAVAFEMAAELAAEALLEGERS